MPFIGPLAQWLNLSKSLVRYTTSCSCELQRTLGWRLRRALLCQLWQALLHELLRAWSWELLRQWQLALLRVSGWELLRQSKQIVFIMMLETVNRLFQG